MCAADTHLQRRRRGGATASAQPGAFSSSVPREKQLLESSESPQEEGPEKGATRTSPRQAERAQARTGTGSTDFDGTTRRLLLGTHASMLRCLSEQHIPTHQAGAVHVGGAGSTLMTRKGCEVTREVTLQRPGAGML